MVGLDVGGVSLVDVAVESGAEPNLLASSVEHDDVVTSLSLSGDKTRAATGSKDRWYYHPLTSLFECHQLKDVPSFAS